MTIPVRYAGMQRWTREDIIEKICRWVEVYGEPPKAADLNPSSARWAGQEWKAERYRRGDPETGEPWPSLNATKRLFGGSLNAAIIAAGFEPSRSGPPSRRAVVALNTPERLALTPAGRVALDAARAEAREAQATINVRDRMLAREREAVARLREELAAARRATEAARRERPVSRVESVPRTQAITKTITKRVPDTATATRLRARIERLEAKLAESGAHAKAERAVAAEAARAANAAQRVADGLRAALAEAREEVQRAERERVAAEDRLTAALRAPAPERVVERVVRSASDAEVAEAHAEAQRARKDAHEAEVRAARAERQMREQGAAVTGEARRLTQGELAELRKGGPSGPVLVAKAMREVAEARAKRPAALAAALTGLASAAIRWRDALR
jgi:hypothetical protein